MDCGRRRKNDDAPGDFIITPCWTWHDHGNPSAQAGGEAVVWLEGLDIPLVAHNDAGFAESLATATQTVTRQGAARKLSRHGRGFSCAYHTASNSLSGFHQ
jgi:gentisate 1,2-dioxygenase